MNTKKTFKYFSILDHEKEQDYLRKMHRSGWRFVKVSGIGMYHFEECTPEDVIYQLDYNREGLEHKADYVQMFADCGWEYLQDFAGYSYFRKPASDTDGNEEIFCDDDSRLHMLQRVFRGRVIPLVLLFSAVLIPQFCIYTFVSHNYGISVLYGAIIAVYIAVFIAFAVKYHRYTKR